MILILSWLATFAPLLKPIAAGMAVLVGSFAGSYLWILGTDYFARWREGERPRDTRPQWMDEGRWS